MNDAMLKHEENAFKRNLNKLIDQQCHEFEARTGHRIDGISLEYQAKPKNPSLTLVIENKGLFQCDVDIEKN